MSLMALACAIGVLCLSQAFCAAATQAEDVEATLAPAADVVPASAPESPAFDAPTSGPVVVGPNHPQLAKWIELGIVKRQPPRAWGTEQACGPPDTVGFGDRQTAWASATADGEDEWLELTFAHAVKPVAIHVVET